ncbi:hypothetical protein ACS0TY_015528 [Phlomoides rotata]
MSGSKGRKWRKNVKAVEKEMLLMEEDVKALEEMYAQGEKAETAWAMTVLGYLAKLGEIRSVLKEQKEKKERQKMTKNNKKPRPKSDPCQSKTPKVQGNTRTK